MKAKELKAAFDGIKVLPEDIRETVQEALVEKLLCTLASARRDLQKITKRMMDCSDKAIADFYHTYTPKIEECIQVCYDLVELGKEQNLHHI